jgi:hypothetical protein
MSTEQVAPIGPRTGSVGPASIVEWDAVEAAIDCGLETAIRESPWQDRSPQLWMPIPARLCTLNQPGGFLFCGEPPFGREVIDHAGEMLT